MGGGSARAARHQHAWAIQALVVARAIDAGGSYPTLTIASGNRLRRAGPHRHGAGPPESRRDCDFVALDCIRGVHVEKYARADINAQVLTEQIDTASARFAAEALPDRHRTFCGGALISFRLASPSVPKFSLTSVKKLAKQAADKRKPPEEPIAWSAALAEAPLPDGLPAAWEGEFRKRYAERLVKLGHAKAAGRSGTSGKPGKPTKLHRRLMNAPLEEFEEHDKRAEKAGLSWSTWARRKLLQ